METRLRKIVKYLKAGIIDQETISEALHYSLAKSSEMPGSFNPESLHVTKYLSEENYPKLPLICKNICEQLAALRVAKICVDDIKKAGDELEMRVDIWADEVKSIDIVAHADKLFAACKGSHADKGKAMASKLTDEQWEAYKKAQGGRPITQTIEQRFTQRSRDAAKKPK